MHRKTNSTTVFIAILTPLLLANSTVVFAQAVDSIQRDGQMLANNSKPLPVLLEIKSTLHVANLYAAELNTPAVCGTTERCMRTYL
jgi:hypothetical protein